MNLKNSWWKILALVLIAYSIVAGFIVEVPVLPVIGQTIRNVFFHVGMWFVMIIIMGVSFVYSLKYLSGFTMKNDIYAAEAANVAMLFGILGICTGMLWARATWGVFWVRDPKLDGAAVGLLIYFAYFILRGSLDEEQKRARISAVYNIFAFILLILFLIILPRLAKESIHPGKDANPVLPMNLDPNMRIVFYPAIVGWIMLSVWILHLRVRYAQLKKKLESLK